MSEVEIIAKLKTCYTPAATVQMVKLLIEHERSFAYREGFKAGVEEMALRIRDVYSEYNKDLAIIESGSQPFPPSGLPELETSGAIIPSAINH